MTLSEKQRRAELGLTEWIWHYLSIAECSECLDYPSLGWKISIFQLWSVELCSKSERNQNYIWMIRLLSVFYCHLLHSTEVFRWLRFPNIHIIYRWGLRLSKPNWNPSTCLILHQAHTILSTNICPPKQKKELVMMVWRLLYFTCYALGPILLAYVSNVLTVYSALYDSCDLIMCTTGLLDAHTEHFHYLDT